MSQKKKSFLHYLNPLKPFYDIKEAVIAEKNFTKDKFTTTTQIIKDVVKLSKEQHLDEIDDLLNEENGRTQFLETMYVENWTDEKYFHTLNKLYWGFIGITGIFTVTLTYFIWLSISSEVFGLLYFLFFITLMTAYYFSFAKRYTEFKEQEFLDWGDFLAQTNNLYPNKKRHNEFISIKNFHEWYQNRHPKDELKSEN